jgi:hypothetical protein
MFIRDFSWTQDIGHRPEVELKISDVKQDEFLNLRELAAKGEKIKIEKKKEFFDTDMEFFKKYIKGDIEMPGITLYGRSKIEFMPRDIKVEKVIFNKPATIIFWSDNTKTVVVCGENDEYDAEKGFFIACAKKLFGNDYRAVGRMNKALEMAEDKNERM